jgi:PKD repeat protein
VGCDSAGGVEGDASPQATFTHEASEEGSLTINFDASASEDPDGNIVRYTWDFGGEGQRAEDEVDPSSPTATYTYDRPGVYPVRLVVADQSGGVGRTTQELTVGTVDPGEGPIPLDLSTDLGVLNYAYALEQLEASFYARVLDEGTFSGEVEAVVRDLAAHEDIHRLTLQSVLQSAAMRDLTPNFGDINFGSPEDVLETARMLEVLGVAAYNGAAKLLSSPTFLATAGSIVSVEARHAATVRDLATPMSNFFGGTFPIGGDLTIDDNGLYEARDPRAVLDVASTYVEESFDVQGG